MSKKKKFFIGIGSAVIIAIAYVFYATSGLVETADTFFTAAKNNDIEEAYSCVTESFRTKTSIAKFEMFLERNHLKEVTKAHWSSRSIEGGKGVLEGSVTVESGGVVPLSLHFAKGDGQWKIQFIKMQPAGVQVEEEGMKIIVRPIDDTMSSIEAH